VLPLAACDPFDPNGGAPPPNTQLPAPPASLRTCLKVNGVEIPDRDLTVAEVERLWKTDRLRFVAVSKCGNRLLEWIDDLRKRWR
jgi:hypothetical protein